MSNAMRISPRISTRRTLSSGDGCLQRDEERPVTIFIVASCGLILRPGIQTEIAFHAAIPGIVVAGVQIHPLLVRHSTAPLQKGYRIRSHWVAKLPSPALRDFQD